MIRRAFSLLELVIAAAIVAIAAAVAVEISSRALMQTAVVESEWARAHLLSLCAEYYLASGHQAPAPQDLLPKGYSVTCEIQEKLTETTEMPVKKREEGDYVLASYTLRLYDGGKEVDSLRIDKLVPHGALP